MNDKLQYILDDFKSRPERPHPLFDGFIEASLAGVEGREPVFAAAPQPTPAEPTTTEGSTVRA